MCIVQEREKQLPQMAREDYSRSQSATTLKERLTHKNVSQQNGSVLEYMLTIAAKLSEQGFGTRLWVGNSVMLRYYIM